MEIGQDIIYEAFGSLAACIVSLAGALVALWYKSRESEKDCEDKLDKVYTAIFAMRNEFCMNTACQARENMPLDQLERRIVVRRDTKPKRYNGVKRRAGNDRRKN